MTKKQQTKGRLAVIIGTMLNLMIINSLFGLAWPVMQVQAGPTLPSRELPPPVPPSEKDDDDGDDTPIGAHIELLPVQGALAVQGTPAGAWSVIQWQDRAGEWHNVEGWQGVLDQNGGQRWWVAEKDFGKKSFRWLVTQGLGGPVLGASTPFNLPAGANETVQVAVTVGQ